jgi:hypothetical protein
MVRFNYEYDDHTETYFIRDTKTDFWVETEQHGFAYWLTGLLNNTKDLVSVALSAGRGQENNGQR